MSKIVGSLIVDYDPENGDANLQDAWDYVQKQVRQAAARNGNVLFCQCSKWPLKLG